MILHKLHGIENFTGNEEPIAITKDGRHIAIHKADYLRKMPRDEISLANLSKLPKAELHIIGQASPEFINRVNSHGIVVVEIN